MTRSRKRQATTRNAEVVGDHLAINFVNTARMVRGVLTDTFQSDDDVRSWLVRAEVLPSATVPLGRAGTLLRQARLLRDAARQAIEARKAGRRPSLDVINAFLESSVSHCVLGVRAGAQVEMTRVYRRRTAEECLAPIAESVADLLVNGDFDLVRHCEGERCVLWFYDRTRAHRRKYCSPARCGNRAKVAAFRARILEA